VQNGFGTLVVDMPASPPLGTLRYGAQAGDCQSGLIGQSPATVFLQARCQAKGSAPVVAYAYDEASNKSAWAFEKGNAISGDAGAAPVSGLGAWSTTFGTLGFNLTNAPAGAGSVNVSNAEIAGGVPLHSTDFAAATEGTATGKLVTLPGYAETSQPQVDVQLSSQNVLSVALLSKGIMPPADGATLSFDLAQLLPQLTDGTADLTDAAHPKITWTSSAPFTGADGGFARIAWSATTDAGFQDDGWTFIFPATTTSVQGPQMPASLADWVPPTGTSVFAPVVAVVEEDDIPSYESFLGKYPLLSTIGTNGSYIYAPLLPVGVTLRATYGYNPG